MLTHSLNFCLFVVITLELQIILGDWMKMGITKWQILHFGHLPVVVINYFGIRRESKYFCSAVGMVKRTWVIFGHLIRIQVLGPSCP